MRNAFEYLEYSFFTLFSKRIFRIVGSSVLVEIVVGLCNTLILYMSVQYFGKRYFESGIEDIQILLIQILSVLLGVVTITIFSVGWKSIIIPIRSTETKEKLFNLSEDFTLFRQYFRYFLSYITWYSLFLLVWIILAFGGAGILWIGEYYLLFFLYEVILLGVLCVFQIGLSLSWYNIILEPCFGIEGLKRGYNLTKGIKWKLFKLIFLFSFVVSIANGIVTNLHSLIPTPSITDGISRVETPIVSGESDEPMSLNRSDIAGYLPFVQTLLPSIITFMILFSVEGVLSSAMMQIFLMRLTAEVREEKNQSKGIETVL